MCRGWAYARTVPSFPIQVGSTGDDVRRVQRAIVRWRAYYGLTGHPPMTLPAVDGVFGAVTDAAVSLLEELHERRGRGADALGWIVGPLTWGALGPYKEPTSTVRVGCHRSRRLGVAPNMSHSGPDDDYSFDVAALDGRFGPIHRGLRRRRTKMSRGITVDGIAGEQTWLAPASVPGPTLDTAAGLT